MASEANSDKNKRITLKTFIFTDSYHYQLKLPLFEL